MEVLMKEEELPEGTEVFLFTDNSTAEAAFYKGTSKSKLLFQLVLRLRKLEMEGKLFVHVVWVAGTCMIAQGTDGLSRGDLMNGVLSGQSMLNFVPINKSDEERQPGFLKFLMETMSPFSPTSLTPNDWFDKAFEPSHYVWIPPPSAALEALEQLCNSKQVRPKNANTFACPALMTNQWRKKLSCIADVMFTVPVGSTVWDIGQHEPVIVVLICPLLHCRPWQVKRDWK
ncbi:hypothetical protein ACA910_003984 [Epithemia clementina (nom. ined.)]